MTNKYTGSQQFHVNNYLALLVTLLIRHIRLLACQIPKRRVIYKITVRDVTRKKFLEGRISGVSIDFGHILMHFGVHCGLGGARLHGGLVVSILACQS